MWFEIVSSLRINLEKGELIPIEVASNVEELVLVCGLGVLHATYLGLTLGASFKSIVV